MYSSGTAKIMKAGNETLVFADDWIIYISPKGQPQYIDSVGAARIIIEAETMKSPLRETTLMIRRYKKDGIFPGDEGNT